MSPEYQDLLRRLALNDENAIGILVGADLTADPGALDPRIHALVRLAALIALESASASYAWGVAAAVAAGASDEEVVGVLASVTPVVGLARAGSAARELAEALDASLDAPGRAPGP